MSGVVTGKPRMQRGPETYQVFAAVTAGQLVQPGTAGNAALIGPAAADSLLCLGVATTNGLPAGSAYAGTSPLSGYPVVEAGIPDENVSVSRTGDFVLNCTGTIAFGQAVKCGANGSVVAFVSGTDAPDKKIGKCIDPGGGTNGGTALIAVAVAG